MVSIMELIKFLIVKLIIHQESEESGHYLKRKYWFHHILALCFK